MRVRIKSVPTTCWKEKWVVEVRNWAFFWIEVTTFVSDDPGKARLTAFKFAHGLKYPVTEEVK